MVRWGDSSIVPLKHPLLNPWAQNLRIQATLVGLQAVARGTVAG